MPDAHMLLKVQEEKPSRT